MDGTGRHAARRASVFSRLGCVQPVVARGTVAVALALAGVLGGFPVFAPVAQAAATPTSWMQNVATSGMRAMPWILLAAVIWIALTTYLYVKRKWLRMYLVGAFGFVMFVLFFSQALGLDSALEALEARNAATIATWLSMHIELLGSSGLAIRNHIGWGVFAVGIECSALLELAALVGLIAFYPGFHAPRKASSIAIGLAATYAANIARILLIVGIIAALGTSWVFIAHAVIGRVFFFICIVIIYWYLMTRPTVGAVGVKIDRDPEESDRG